MTRIWASVRYSALAGRDGTLDNKDASVTKTRIQRLRIAGAIPALSNRGAVSRAQKQRLFEFAGVRDCITRMVSVVRFRILKH